jgi:tungstate transport system ATP-binding protein
MVLQNPFLLSSTVEKNVAYGLRIRGLSKREQKQKVVECLDLVGLTGFEKRRAHELSGGEAQRVAIARGIAVTPKVLFLDEPTANVDKTHIDVLENIIKELNRRYKTTIIFTTHDLNQAYRLASEIVVLSEGKIKEILTNQVFRLKAEG